MPDPNACILHVPNQSGVFMVVMVWNILRCVCGAHGPTRCSTEGFGFELMGNECMAKFEETFHG